MVSSLKQLPSVPHIFMEILKARFNLNICISNKIHQISVILQLSPPTHTSFAVCVNQDCIKYFEVHNKPCAVR